MTILQTPTSSATAAKDQPLVTPERLTHIQRLEAESIQIMREVVAECDKPVMLYSIGKDSAAMLHVALKAFYPAPPPFPLLHVDTTWKFRAMYEMRERMARDFKERVVPAGTVLIRQGDEHGMGFFILVEGEVALRQGRCPRCAVLMRGAAIGAGPRPSPDYDSSSWPASMAQLSHTFCPRCRGSAARS